MENKVKIERQQDAAPSRTRDTCTTSKPSGFAAVISSGGTTTETGAGDNSNVSDERRRSTSSSMSEHPTSATTPLDDDPCRLQIDSTRNSPASSNATPVSIVASSVAPASQTATPVPSSTTPVHGRPAATNTMSQDGRSPQAVRSRSGTTGSAPFISQHNTVTSSNTVGSHAGIHQPPPANFHLAAPTSNSAGVILPFATGGAVHSQHYGLLASTFGGGGGQTIIVNQYGQPVGVVSPSPAAGPQAVSLPSHSVSSAATAMQANPSVSQQYSSSSPAVSACGASRPPPLIMAYRQPGLPQQQLNAHSHLPPPNSSASNAATNANMAAAAAAAAAAAGMHSIPLFPSHFNPFATCNTPILLPTGQMVFRTPQGQLIGFQVPTMASHHPVPAPPPPPPLDQPPPLQQTPQQQPASKYSHVLPKIAPSANAAGLQSGQQQSIPVGAATAGTSAACGPFAAMQSSVTSLLQQQLAVPPKSVHKTMPVLPMVPRSSAAQTGNPDGSTTTPETVSQVVPEEAGRLPNDACAENSQAGLSSISRSPASTKLPTNVSAGAGAKKAKTGPSGTKGKTKRKSSTVSSAPPPSTDCIPRNDAAAGSLTRELKGVTVIDDDPGPLRVFTTENSEQMANEIHEMFTRALAEHRNGDGPPQVLTHIIDGFVIQESMDPFPISPHPFDDFNIASVVMTTDSLSEWSAPPQLSPACAKQAVKPDASQEPAVCPNCGRVIEEAPYTKAPAYCSRFCYKAFQRMEETSLSPGGRKHDTAGASAVYSSGTSSVQSPVAAASPKSKLSPNGCAEGKPQADSSSTDAVGDGLLQMVSPGSGIERSTMKRPEEWTVDDVCSWIATLGSAVAQHSSTFRQQEIDGQALLLLEEDHLIRGMGMKFGPALKLCAALKSLRGRH